ncbi:MAG: hypothetical protein PVF28_05475 [Thioalkalispiraceae bacterium]|jgi:hypothetical protein
MANQEPQELLSALESIKGLLEKSESKLNAARESIEIASPKQAAKKAEQEIAELDIPEVEEIVEIPELDEIVVPAQSADAQPTVDIEVLKAFLDEMQKQIEKTMRDKLMKAVVAAENDVKKQMRAYLDQLRKMLDQ